MSSEAVSENWFFVCFSLPCGPNVKNSLSQILLKQQPGHQPELYPALNLSPNLNWSSQKHLQADGLIHSVMVAQVQHTFWVFKSVRSMVHSQIKKSCLLGWRETCTLHPSPKVFSFISLRASHTDTEEVIGKHLHGKVRLCLSVTWSQLGATWENNFQVLESFGYKTANRRKHCSGC